MATKLLKPVRRELLASSVIGKYRNRPIIASLEPGDDLKFRIKGTRISYNVTLHACYRLAQLATWERQYRDKWEAYQVKKKAGIKCRKPKPLTMMFDKALITAMKNTESYTPSNTVKAKVKRK